MVTMRCIACNSWHSEHINHRQADDGQVWITRRCLKCDTKWNVHFDGSNREIKRLLKKSKKMAAIRLNMRGSGNSLIAARDIVNQIEGWIKEEKSG
jgi:transcriptional regulator NrdR family protein